MTLDDKKVHREYYYRMRSLDRMYDQGARCYCTEDACGLCEWEISNIIPLERKIEAMRNN